MEFFDWELTCVECNKTFVFSAGEQAFFRDKGFKNEPKRCKQCKARRDGVKRPQIEIRVTCAECSKETTVPFKPVKNTRVLCSVCFQKQIKQPKTGNSLVKPAEQTG
jgi:CxxC-x17-CxxC domain-containing protein